MARSRHHTVAPEANSSDDDDWAPGGAAARLRRVGWAALGSHEASDTEVRGEGKDTEVGHFRAAAAARRRLSRTAAHEAL